LVGAADFLGMAMWWWPVDENASSYIKLKDACPVKKLNLKPDRWHD
jgi:hypothetical protein